MTKKIIVIDDSLTVREQVGDVLSTAGYAIVEAVDGLAGADAIRNNPDASLAICDLHMPRLGGLALLELLRAEGTSKVPFLMLTTEGAVELLEKARALGAKGWMVKPFKPALLLATVRKLERAVPA
jgi:two-component system chemotaxis response regulator CheY